LALAAKAHRLVYSKSVTDYNIWRLAVPAPGENAQPPARFLASTRFETSPAWSPDGRRVAFSSSRGGVRQIWVADADASNATPLTAFTDGAAGSPRWSPDGQTIVFDARPGGNSDVYVVRADGGTPKRLTQHPAQDHVPCFSVDGRWIYFASTRSGKRQIYRIPAGGGDPVQITRNTGFAPIASPDGKWIYYSGDEKEGIWKVPVEGGEETQIVPSLSNAFCFSVAARGIYFQHGDVTRSLGFYRFADGKTADIASFNRPTFLHLSVSPDEHWLLYTQLDQTIDDLVLVDNFR
jgi:Tol biopolymer transport system component